MAIQETGVSYYGLTHVEHVRRDFQEMMDHHCTAVLLALSEFVWIEAERFEDYGGWANDAQFIDQMGSPYLLAAGDFPVQVGLRKSYSITVIRV